MADEYAMHVYFACRGSDRDRGAILAEVAGPVSFGALATLASFAVLPGRSAEESPVSRPKAGFTARKR